MLAKDINLDEAFSKSYEISGQEIEHQDKFSNYSPMYLAPTSNVKEAVKQYETPETALVVGSMGAYPFELAIKGTKRIDCFDKNTLQYMVFELIKTAVKVLEYEDFIIHFTHPTTNTKTLSPNFFSEFVIEQLIYLMDYPADMYWAELSNFSVYRLIHTNLFRTLYVMTSEHLKTLSSIYTYEGFYALKHKLNRNEVEINYHIRDISDIPYEFSDQKYNLVMFDNIFQYYKSIPGLNNASAINSFITKKIDPMLMENGQVQVGYGFEVASSAVSTFLNRKQDLPPFVLNNIGYKLQIAEELKQGYMPQLLKRYPENYETSFIPGAEIHPNYKPENVILSYKKRS